MPENREKLDASRTTQEWRDWDDFRNQYVNWDRVFDDYSDAELLVMDAEEYDDAVGRCTNWDRLLDDPRSNTFFPDLFDEDADEDVDGDEGRALVPAAIDRDEQILGYLRSEFVGLEIYNEDGTIVINFPDDMSVDERRRARGHARYIYGADRPIRIGGDPSTWMDEDEYTATRSDQINIVDYMVNLSNDEPSTIQPSVIDAVSTYHDNSIRRRGHDGVSRTTHITAPRNLGYRSRRGRGNTKY